MLLKNKHIFIVEDNVSNRVIFQMALIRDGAEVDFERHGRDTLDRLGNLTRIDLIILDLMLAGGISGFDLYDEIRKLPGYEKVPVVAVSAMYSGIAIPQVRAKGMNGFIAKPIDGMMFAQQISKVIDGAEVWYAGEMNMM